jgi:soluble lytic murein transglycosylase-like protein
MRLRPAVLVIAGVLAAVWPSAAHAQIYAWRDAGGNLVLSDQPKNPAALTFPVGSSGTVRVARLDPVTRVEPARRGAEYDGVIEEHASANGLSPELVRAVIHAESAFNPRARSVKGAMGLMQLMPATAREYGVLDPYNPAENIRAGVSYLKSLLLRYSNNEELALAAYNAGPTAVAKYGAVPPYRETRNYVEKIRGAAAANAGTTPARIYKTVEIVDGRPVVKYSNVRTPGSELVSAAMRR